MQTFHTAGIGPYITQAIERETHAYNAPTRLESALTALTPPPCVDCPFSEDCAANLKACKDFRLYVDTGLFPVREPSSRAPSTIVYNRIYRNFDYDIGKRRGRKPKGYIDSTQDSTVESQP